MLVLGLSVHEETGGVHRNLNGGVWRVSDTQMREAVFLRFLFI